MSIDLSSLTLKELTKLHADVSKAIETFEIRRKRDALDQLEAHAREMGFALSDLVDGLPEKRTRVPAVARYKNPDKPFDTWSGRGRQPKWFAAALAAGKTPGDLTI